jgi:outer membrane receptor protein involved in Fe transport
MTVAFNRTAPIILLALAVVGFPQAIVAQMVGVVRGRVSDEAGAPIPGATVTLSSRSQGVSGKGAVTDATGSFQVPTLPPARDYVLRASFPGRATVDLTGVEVLAGQATSLRVVLPPESALRERVEVRATPRIVSLEDPTTETRFSAEFIAALPILGRNYQDVLALAPGVSDIDGDGNPNIHGARDTDVITLVDGVSTTDPLTGKVGAQLNIESIQEIEIKTSGATAEFGRAQGGFANIVTKSGGNEFQGTFKFYWRGGRLDGDGAGTDDPHLHFGLIQPGGLSFNDYKPFLALEGPIVKDRAWYFMAHEYIQVETPINAIANRWVERQREFREFVKLTWQASANQRLALSLNYDPFELTNQGLGSRVSLESGYTDRRGGPILTLKAISIFSPLVALETTLSSFHEKPQFVPTTDPDTNGNGVLFYDRNGNGIFEPRERDPGEDYDNDGRFDVFEDTEGELAPNGRLDPGEDVDRDGRLTPPLGCEGFLREDVDCDGMLDPGEDRNGNGLLDDTPFPQIEYPYGTLTPLRWDKDYGVTVRQSITSGPYFQDISDRRRRFTLKQDLSVYSPQERGSHDIRMGVSVEREQFHRDNEIRPIVFELRSERTRRGGVSRPMLAAFFPADGNIANDATSWTQAAYFQDAYKPLPNLSLGLGVRFDRERIDSFGYNQFDPRPERAEYDRLNELAGSEGSNGLNPFLEGDHDGVVGEGIWSDPLFYSRSTNNVFQEELSGRLKRLALARLTRHHVATGFSSQELASLFPEIVVDGEIDPALVAAFGLLPQQKEAFALTNNNLAPRLSASWDPWSDGRTRLFATWGRYYDKLFLESVVGEEGPDFINQVYIRDPDGVDGAVPNHMFGDPVGHLAPPTATQVDRGLQTPWSDEWTVGFEREIAPEVAVSFTYINRKYRAQLQDVDVNHVLGRIPSGLVNEDLEELSPALVGRLDLFNQNFFFNQILRIGNYNEAHYRGLEVELIKRLARRWQMQASYTYGRAVGAAESFRSFLGNDPSTIEGEFGNLDYDQRHTVKVNGLVYLPRDWQIGFTSSWNSGLPYSIVARILQADSASYLQYSTQFGYHVVDPETKEVHFVPLRRNSERNHPWYDFNLQARKNLVLGRTTGSLSLEIFNLLNSDDLRILEYQPSVAAFDPVGDAVSVPSLDLDAQRRFGRRFQVGFQVEF